MSIRGPELSRHFSEHQRRADAIYGVYKELDARIVKAQHGLQSQLSSALGDLAEAYLQELTPASLVDLANRAGFKKLLRRDPLKAMAHERVVLLRRIAVIEADERYVRRQWLVGPNGEFTRALAEAQSLLDPWDETCEQFEQHKHFLTLIELGYDTPAYSVSWLEARYWTYWAAGDKICRELGMDDFGDDVEPAYELARVEREKWRGQVAAVNAKVDAVHELIREHDQSIARVARLPEIYLTASREAVVQFLGLADPPLLAQWNDGHARPDRAVTMGLRRVAGLRAKVEALQELQKRGVRPFMADMAQRLQKYRRKANKFARPKNNNVYFTDSHSDQKFAGKEGKYRQRAAQSDQLVTRILSYDAYDRFDVAVNAPELWFREMTGKRPSRMFPGLRGWYDRQHDARPVRAPDPDADLRAAQAVAAASSFVDLGYMS
ncbi:MAG: hypothetical protein ACI9MC_002396 [Kiritimatiellia bacterium]|jgi:hypothetical protein